MPHTLNLTTDAENTLQLLPTITTTKEEEDSLHHHRPTIALQHTTMGADAGFDINPPLEEDEQLAWNGFLQLVKDEFASDPVFKETADSLIFEVGEHPRLPKKCTRFRRFSAKITGSHAGGVSWYLDTVQDLALAYPLLGGRIKPWNELFDVWGVYSWPEVYDAEKED